MTQPQYSQPQYSQPAPMPASTPPVDDGEHIHGGQRLMLVIARAITYFMYAYLVVVEIILFLGFLLLLFGANPSSGFVEWWYRNLDRVMEPFRGIFSPIELGMTGNDVEAVFETSVLFAMVIYGIVALLVSGLTSWLSTRIRRIDIEDRQYHQRLAWERQQQLDRESAERAARMQASVQPPPAPSPTPTPAPAEAPAPPPTTDS